MDRRSFLKSASAAGLLPLMPALPAASTAAAAPVANEFMYGLAVFNARLRGVSSPDKISRDLGIAKEAARRLHGRMLNDGFVSLPNAAGLSRTSEPFAQSIKLRRDTAEKLKAIFQDKLEDVKEDLLSADTDDAPKEPASEPTET